MKAKLFIRLLGILMACVLLMGSAVTVFAAGADVSPADLTRVPNWPKAPEIASENAILMEAKTGAILYTKNDTEPCHPASITKLMTALLVMENCNLDDTVTFSYRATHELESGATSIARTEGEELSVRDCLYALLLASANEVAQALAEHVSGSIEDFAVLMNKRAQELGCTGSSFVNPSGLNDDAHVTTCRDMAVIMRECLKHQEFLDIESHTTYTIPATNKNPEELTIAQHHKLVKKGGDHYDGADAGKTGYTTIAGNTLVTSASRGDMQLICVIMRSQATHYQDTRALLDYGFNNFSMINLSAAESLELVDAEGNSIDLPDGVYIPSDEWLVLPRSMDFAGLDTQVELSSSESSNAGVIHYTHKGAELGTALLVIDQKAALEAASSRAAESSAALESSKAETGLSGVKKKLKKMHPLRDLQERCSEMAEETSLRGVIFSALLTHPILALIAAASALGFLILLIYALIPHRTRHRNNYYLPGERRRKKKRKKNKYTMRF